MTLLTDPTLAATLISAGIENNPFVAWQNLGAAAVAATVIGTEVSAAVKAADTATYNFWSVTPDVSDRAALRFVFPASVTLNFVGLAAHNLGDLGGTVAVQYSTNSGSSWTSVPPGTMAPSDNREIAWRFEDITADYWRILLDGVTEDAVIGVCLFSEYLTIPRRIYSGYTPPLTPTEVKLQSNVSEGGHLLGTSRARSASTASASFNLLDPEFVRGADWLGFQQAFNDGQAFFWSWRPDKYAQDLFYAWRTGKAIVPTNGGPGALMSLEMAMRLYDDR